MKGTTREGVDMDQPKANIAPDVETVDVEPVNKPDQRAQYEKRRKIHPRRVHGNFRRLKWIAMSAMLAIYYLSPWKIGRAHV